MQTEGNLLQRSRNLGVEFTDENISAVQNNSKQKLFEIQLI